MFKNFKLAHCQDNTTTEDQTIFIASFSREMSNFEYPNKKGQKIVLTFYCEWHERKDVDKHINLKIQHQKAMLPVLEL